MQLEVIAKHTLTGDDHIGTANLSLEAMQVWLSCFATFTKHCAISVRTTVSALSWQAAVCCKACQCGWDTGAVLPARWPCTMLC